MSRLFLPTPKSLWQCLSLLCIVCAAGAASTPAGWLNEGSPAATPYFVSASSNAGPTVLVVGGLHGNEPAGPCAAEEIRHWPAQRGRIVIVPRANPLALDAATRALKPKDSTNRFDLNPAFPPTVGTTNPAALLAQSLWWLVQHEKPHWLLDLHEGADFRAQTTNSVGSSVIPCTSPEARQIGERMVKALNAGITNTDRQFLLLKQPIRGSLARAAAAELGIRSMIVETTSKGQPLSLRARQHRIAVFTLLHELNMLGPGVTPECLLPASPPLGTIRVAVYDGVGTGGKGVTTVLAQLEGRTNVICRRVCPEDIRAGALKPFDAVMFTGGSGSGQGKALGDEGRAEVTRFVAQGGGYIGICAGAYLACSGFDWSLGVADAKTLSPLWQRGTDMVKLELTEKGRAILGGPEGLFDCLYYQGPIVGPAGVATVPDYEPLAFFRTEVAKNNTPKGIMVNSPAAFCGRFGQGRVLCFSPHPEQTNGLESLVARAVTWVTGVEDETAAQR